jgi:hypothetical protein
MKVLNGLPRKPALCLGAMLLLHIGLPAPAVAEFAGRLAISADGNDHDRDDIGATPMSLAILAKAGLQRKLVHYEFNNHIWSSFTAAQQRDMTDSALGAAERFGFARANFYSAIDNPTNAYNHLAAEINRSSSGDPLYILAMGPMETVCQGIRRSDPFKRSHVTVVSHSAWNDNHQHNGSCTWTELAGTGVRTVHITDQNSGLATPNLADVAWLATHPDPNLRWVWSRMQIGISWQVVADVSDAGEVWFWLTNGDQNGTFAKLKAFFGDGTGVPPPDPGGSCSVTGTGSTSSEALYNARQLFEVTCGVTYGSSPDHDCDPNNAAQTSWTCSTTDIGSPPVEPPPSGECSASGTGSTSMLALSTARSNFELTCGVTYGSNPDHDCDPTNTAQTAWTCSTFKMY